MNHSDSMYAKMYAHGTYKRKPWFHHWSLSMASKIRPFLQKGSLLEVGCGPGHISSYFDSVGFKVLGIDNDPYMIHEARKLWEIPFKWMDVRDLNDDTSWQNIVCIHDVINAIEDNNDSLLLLFRKFHQQLSINGKLVFDLTTDMGFESWREVQIQDRGDYFKVDRGVYNKSTGMATLTITAFFQEKNDDFFSRFQKTVDNYYHMPSHVYKLLVETGFDVTVFKQDLATPEQNHNLDSDSDNKLFFICNKL